MGLNHNTPLEKYKLKGIDVWVKRDDLHNGDLDLPPWAKIEGVKRLMENVDKNKPLVHLTVRGSYTGCLLYTSPSPRDKRQSRMPSSA